MAGMAIVSREATFVGLSLNSLSRVSCVAHHQLAASTVSPSTRFNVLTSFSGQQLTRESKVNSVVSLRRCTPAVKAHQHNHSIPPGSTSPIDNISLGSDYVLDDLSRYIYRKLSTALSPYFPDNFDALGWLPESIHKRLHKGELGAIILLREVLHFSLFYLLFNRVDAVCKFLNWLYVTKTQFKEVSEGDYASSSFRAMTSPMRLLILVWAGTRLGHILAPVLRLNLGLHVTSKIRSIGLIVAVTWFFFKWKQLYVVRLASAYRLDAPRIYAFDKVVSLLMYYLAASCIGEVTGFALRSLLAVGGFSGIAIGLAAREIVSNFFGGALLFITRPFVIGERIKAEKFSGYVQDIGFLQTKILSGERVPMVVPNQNFINQVITNYSRAVNKLMEAEFPVRQQDIFLVDRITSSVVKYLRTHPDVDVNKSPPLCFLKTINPSGIIVAVSCILRPSGGSEFYRVQQSILVHVAEIISAEGAALQG